MNIYTIYRATNTINGKVYIGFDSAWPKRKRGHKSSAETRLKISQKLKNLDRVMVCRIHDKKVMDIHHYSRWANQTSIYCNLNQSAIDSCPV